MKKDGYILDQLVKTQLPAVPEQFFRHFSDELWQLIELEDNTEGLLDILELSRFENDFKTVKAIDLEVSKLKQGKTSIKLVKTTKTKQILLWAGAIAASLVLFFTWPSTTNSGTELASEETTQEVLLAYLDEDDLVDYLVDASTNKIEDIVLEEEVLYEAVEDEIYNYINDI
ncbi:MAG: hypothetical protein AB8B74_09935 [Crocinitomicaceae bacterium]